jgi:hypothetical protein
MLLATAGRSVQAGRCISALDSLIIGCAPTQLPSTCYLGDNSSCRSRCWQAPLSGSSLAAGSCGMICSCVRWRVVASAPGLCGLADWAAHGVSMMVFQFVRVCNKCSTLCLSHALWKGQHLSQRQPCLVYSLQSCGLPIQSLPIAMGLKD